MRIIIIEANSSSKKLKKYNSRGFGKNSQINIFNSLLYNFRSENTSDITVYTTNYNHSSSEWTKARDTER